MLDPGGRRRASLGLAQSSDDHVVLRHGGAPLVCWPVDPGYPHLNDQDAANPGKGEYVVTWRATLPESLVLGNLAEDVQVVGADGVILTESLMTATCPKGIHKDVGKILLVYVNELVR
mgnify:CR=1 FL=1